MLYFPPLVAMLGLGAAAPLLMVPPGFGGPLPASYISSPQHTTRNLDHPVLYPEQSNDRAEPITASGDNDPSLPKRSESTTEAGDVTDLGLHLVPIPKRSESTTGAGEVIDEPGKLP